MQNLRRERELHYRRGLVLGLSLAEVLLLVVFILLVLIAIGFARQQQQAVIIDARPDITLSDYEALLGQVSFVSEIREDLGLAPDEPLPDDFMEAVVAMAKSTDLAAVRERQERLDATIQALQDQGIKDPEALIRGYADSKGRVEQLQKQLRTAGAGRVFPSCWATEQGDIVYLLNVELTPDGLRVAEVGNPGREKARSGLPMRPFSGDDLLSPRDFLSRTKAVFDRSVTDNCRFYVNVSDRTAAEQKQLYKELLSAVEGHFYKKER